MSPVVRIFPVAVTALALLALPETARAEANCDLLREAERMARLRLQDCTRRGGGCIEEFRVRDQAVEAAADCPSATPSPTPEPTPVPILEALPTPTPEDLPPAESPPTPAATTPVSVVDDERGRLRPLPEIQPLFGTQVQLMPGGSVRRFTPQSASLLLRHGAEPAFSRGWSVVAEAGTLQRAGESAGKGGHSLQLLSLRGGRHGRFSGAEFGLGAYQASESTRYAGENGVLPILAVWVGPRPFHTWFEFGTGPIQFDQSDRRGVFSWYGAGVEHTSRYARVRAGVTYDRVIAGLDVPVRSYRIGLELHQRRGKPAAETGIEGAAVLRFTVPLGRGSPLRRSPDGGRR